MNAQTKLTAYLFGFVLLLVAALGAAVELGTWASHETGNDIGYLDVDMDWNGDQR